MTNESLFIAYFNCGGTNFIRKRTSIKDIETVINQDYILSGVKCYYVKLPDNYFKGV